MYKFKKPIENYIGHLEEEEAFMIIYQLDITHWYYTKRKNWLKSTDESDVDFIDDEKTESYTIYFPTFEQMSNYLDMVTIGHEQYWYDVIERTDGDVELIEYHNGTEWDREINVEIKKVRLHQSLVDTILNLHEEENNE